MMVQGIRKIFSNSKVKKMMFCTLFLLDHDKRTTVYAWKFAVIETLSSDYTDFISSLLEPK